MFPAAASIHIIASQCLSMRPGGWSEPQSPEDDGVVGVPDDPIVDAQLHCPTQHSALDIHSAHLQIRVSIEAGEETVRIGVKISHVAENERATERTQRRGGVDAVEEAFHATVTENVHVIDRVGPGSYSANQRGQLRCRNRALIGPGGGNLAKRSSARSDRPSFWARTMIGTG